MLGTEKFLKNPYSFIKKKNRIALIANPSSVDSYFCHIADIFYQIFDTNLRLLFGPEHGIKGIEQDMIPVKNEDNGFRNIKEISLYGDTFESLSPKKEALKEIDVLVFDIQDIGSRYYTYLATMALCMKVVSQIGIKMIVLDRPNPINGKDVEGGGLDKGLENFCALYPIPQRHGMSSGEIALLYNEAFGIGCDLKVVPCDGWRRSMYLDETDFPWVMPSPNMPTLNTAIVYPGMCLLEGTNISEGRGTTRPFELFGAPFIDSKVLSHELKKYSLEGVIFRPCSFMPMFHKFSNKICVGLQLHITNRNYFKPYRTGLAIIHAIKNLWSEHFKWRTEMYEFRDDVPAIDLLTGTSKVRLAIDRGDDFERVLELSKGDLTVYNKYREKVLLYS